MENVYFDHIAATPVSGEAIKKMAEILKADPGNPDSVHYRGESAMAVLDEARQNTAQLINADAGEVIFTSSATESNNVALKGMAAASKKGKHIIISGIEHYSVLHPAKTLEKQGWELTVLGVDAQGRISPEEAAGAVREDTALVSVIMASSEIGTIQDIKKIAQSAKSKGALFHTDAAAAAGRIPIDVKELGIDAMTVSAQSFGGPPGAAALYIRNGVKVIPLAEGGIQESGIRPGTRNLPAIAGMGEAARMAAGNMHSDSKKLDELAEAIRKGLTDKVNHIYFTGDPVKRLPGHVSLCVEYIEGEAMLLSLSMKGVAVSSGSACTSKALKASHVLLACGIDHALAQGSLVISLGAGNVQEDAEYFIETFPPIVERLRSMSPLYNKD